MYRAAPSQVRPYWAPIRSAATGTDHAEMVAARKQITVLENELPLHVGLRRAWAVSCPGMTGWCCTSHGGPPR
jgi:hypothetical protein